jgi:phosphoribosylamine-glycine ligase
MLTECGVTVMGYSKRVEDDRTTAILQLLAHSLFQIT